MSLHIYKSSAGSGKTYTLAKEYIKLLIQNPLQHPNILAVTFTNKATQEMKERIIQFLIKLSKGLDANLLALLKTETKFSENHIQDNAKKALQQILHNYGDFTVVTIDSFFNRVIKAFAHEMKLPLRMEVQLDTDEALDQAYDRLMLQLNIDRELAQYVTNFMFYKLENDKGWYVEREIKDLGKELFKESFDPVFKSLDKIELSKIQKLIEDTGKFLGTFNNTIKEFGQEWFQQMSNYGLELKDFFHGKNGPGYFGNYLLDINTEKLTKPTDRLIDALDNVEKWHSKTSKKAAAIQNCAPFLMEIANNALKYWEEQKSNYQISLMLFKNLHALGLLKNINEQLKAFRDENDKILISDQNRLINEIISQSDVPFLYEKTGSKYRHFLLDEFQDTSAMQWLNFRPLLENALAEGGEVLVVGDGKQSIYRWRGGEMTLLLKKIGEDLVHYTQADTVKNLNANYRSRKEIIEFNNLFFSGIAQYAKEKLGAESALANLAFADVSQKTTAQTKNGGLVNISFFTATENEQGERVKAKTQIDQELLNTINSLHKEGFEYGDMACLVFTNAQGANVAELLKSHKIPVQSNDSLLLKLAPAVKLLVAFLKYQQNQNNALIRGQITAIMCQMGLINTSLHHSLQEAKASNQSFQAMLNPQLLSCLNNSSGNLLHQVNQLITAAEINHFQPEYLQRFTELVYNFEIKKESHLGDFLEWWQETENNHCIQTTNKQDAVVIQTIHRSKGLQYPVVLIPYAKRGLETKSSDILWLENETLKEEWLDFLPLNYKKTLLETPYAQQYQAEKELSFVDALNMLYVAFTRPEDRLYVFAIADEKHSEHTGRLLQEYMVKSPELSQYIDANSFEKQAPEKKERLEKKTEFTELVKTQTEQTLLRKPRLRIADLERKSPLPFQKGILAHELLARIKNTHEISKCLDIALSEGLFHDDEKDFWQEKLTEILSLPQYKEWNEHALLQLNEQEILTSFGALRPDKIIIMPNKVVVLDYKTGQPKPEHEQQIMEYVGVIQELNFDFSKLTPSDLTTEKTDFDNTTIEAYLLYTENLQLIKVN